MKKEFLEEFEINIGLRVFLYIRSSGMKRPFKILVFINKLGLSNTLFTNAFDILATLSRWFGVTNLGWLITIPFLFEYIIVFSGIATHGFILKMIPVTLIKCAIYDYFSVIQLNIRLLWLLIQIYFCLLVLKLLHFNCYKYKKIAGLQIYNIATYLQ